MKKTMPTNSGLTFFEALFIAFMCLRLVGVISWSWWWVTAPLWGWYALVIVAAVRSDGSPQSFVTDSLRGDCKRACASGALMIGARGDWRLWGAALDVLVGIVGSVADWNDSLPPGRAGWEQVIEAFGKAIEAERGKEAT